MINIAEITPKYLAKAVIEKPQTTPRAKITVHKKLENPQTCSPALNTKPWPAARLFAYLKEIKASSKIPT